MGPTIFSIEYERDGNPHIVREGEHGVTGIGEREQNLGDHGHIWFDVFGEHGTLLLSIAPRAVYSIQYRKSP